MVSFLLALEKVIQHTSRMEAEQCGLESSHGRVLRQEIRADRDIPSFDRVMMDGYALRACELESCRHFSIMGSSPAGKPQSIVPAERGVCLEVMTGAPMPRGADTIIPVERVHHDADGGITVPLDYESRPGAFIHRAGTDAKAGDVLLDKGMMIDSRVIGVAASCGSSSLQVSRMARIAIQPTGDELVAVDAIPAPYQIRQSNGHAIRAALSSAGYPADLHPPLGDDSNADTVSGLLESNDWLIFSGAISKGARDFLPGLLSELRCTLVFHGVAQRPGKPAGFWLGPQGQCIMALPGNPVSALTGLHAFVLPALAVASGLPFPARRLVIPAADVRPLPEMTWHLPVFLDASGRCHSTPTGNSGDFVGLLKSDGFITMPPRGAAQAAYPFTPWQ